MPTTSYMAENVREEAVTVIQMMLARIRARKNAIKRGQLADPNNDLASLFNAEQELLLQFTNLHAHAYNQLNDSEDVKKSAVQLANAAAAAKEETKRIKKLTSKVQKFTDVVNLLTNIVMGLSRL